MLSQIPVKLEKMDKENKKKIDMELLGVGMVWLSFVFC